MSAVGALERRVSVSNAFEGAVQPAGDRFAERVVLGAWKLEIAFGYSSSVVGVVANRRGIVKVIEQH